MATISGASGFLNASTLSNTKGLAAQSASLMGEGGIGAISLLDVGRSTSVPGIGISAQARYLNSRYLKDMSGLSNGLFSATVNMTSSVEGLRQKIMALRAGRSDSQLAPSLRGNTVDTKA